MPAPSHIAIICASLVAACATVSDPRQQWFEVRGGAWTVDVSTIDALSTAIQGAVRTLAGQRFGSFPSWDSYTFQYQGQASEEVRYVYVNAFCDLGDRASLEVSFVQVFDGGTCYFRVKYDPTTGRFFDLSVNGVA